MRPSRAQSEQHPSIHNNISQAKPHHTRDVPLYVKPFKVWGMTMTTTAGRHGHQKYDG
jgi:hypothetical protein